MLRRTPENWSGARRRRGSRGAMMVDVALALTIGAVVLLATVSLITASAGASDAAKQNNVAYNAARQVVENIRLRKGAKLANTTAPVDASDFGNVPQLQELRGTASGGATALVTVAPWDQNPRAKVVTVTISWTAGDTGRARTRTISALVTPEGIMP